MKKIAFLFLVGGLCIHSVAVSEDRSQCANYPEVTQNTWPYYTDAQCDCSSNLAAKYKYKEPLDMKLIAVCDFRKSGHSDSYGGFFFRGRVTKTAPATYVQGSLGGPRLHFDYWKFIDREAAFTAFNVPALTATNLCWRAEATVEVTQLLIMQGPGTDEDGEWPMKYRVVSIGNYKACDASQY